MGDNGVKISRAAAAPAVAAPELTAKPAFAKATLSEDEVVERLVALQESLPPQIAARVEMRMSLRRAQVPAAMTP